MPVDEDQRRLDALDAKIAALRTSRAPRRSAGSDKFSGAALAWRMVTELVVGVLLGSAIGWGLDTLAGTMPLFLVVFLLLGFAAGVRTMMRSATEVNRRAGDSGDSTRG